jgi:8-oxo-dGTP pyrophosphatase MutT (NUDIX family)
VDYLPRCRALILDPSGRLLLGVSEFGVHRLPGGKIGDFENPVDAIMREIKEETGLDQFTRVDFLFDHCDNHVFLLELMDIPICPQPSFDPDQEFASFEWFNLEALPEGMDEYTESIIYRFLLERLKGDVCDISAGVVEVLVDDELFCTLDDDTIWTTLPRLAQERAGGKKVDFRQILDDGTVINQDAIPMPIKAGSDACWLSWPVWIDGDEYHITLKWFGDKDVTPTQLRSMLCDLDLDPTSLLEFTPQVFKTEDDEEVRVLKIVNHPRSWLEAWKRLNIIRTDDYPEYKAHITVPKEFWDRILKEDLTFKHLGFEMGPLQLKRGKALLGEIITSPDTATSNSTGQLQKAYTYVDELLNAHIPDELTRPTLDVAYGVQYFAKTTYHHDGLSPITRIVINQAILNKDGLLRQVLAHEIIHHHIYQKHGMSVDPHSEEFDSIAERINRVEGPSYVTRYANETHFAKATLAMSG